MRNGELRANTLSVWTGSNATLATLATAMQDFLQGAGTPALTDSARVHDIEVRFDGTNYFAVIVYSE